jgi:hypothetical protein
VPAPTELEASWRAAVDDSDPLAALRAARQLRDALLDWESQLARAALAGGETWETIGAALGISRQAAWERLRRGIAGQIEAERQRLRAERARLAEQRRKR